MTHLGDAMGIGAIYGLLMGELGDEAPSYLGSLDTETSWYEKRIFVVGRKLLEFLCT